MCKQSAGRPAAPCARAISPERRAHRTVDVAHGVFQALRSLIDDAGERVPDHLLGQFALVERGVGGFDAEARLAVGDAALGKQHVEFQLALLVGFTG